MVNVEDLKNLCKEYLIGPDELFKEIKFYLTSSFEWGVDTMKPTQFMIRGIIIPDKMKIGDLLEKFLPQETIILKEI